MATIHTASFYQPENWVGTPYRISLYHPRGRRNKWESVQALYPPVALLRDFRSGRVDFETYIQLYMESVEANYFNDIKLHHWLEEVALLDSLTLLCFEREGERCHRHPLAYWLAERQPGMEVGELR